MKELKSEDLKPSDFRTGNLVKCKISNDAGVYQVIAIDGWNYYLMLSDARKGEWIPMKKIKPIPLTEEWLLKFGAKWNGGDHYDINGWWIDSNQGGYFFCRPMLSSSKFKYVHQLQNLFFALTNTELNP